MRAARYIIGFSLLGKWDTYVADPIEHNGVSHSLACTALTLRWSQNWQLQLQLMHCWRCGGWYHCRLRGDGFERVLAVGTAGFHVLGMTPTLLRPANGVSYSLCCSG
jgi:hypothetical protein